MASESSSAILDLNDADTEDTEAGSVTDDARDGAPLIMDHGYDIAVKVDAPMKQLSTMETFVTYRVRCVCARWPTPPHVRRRYNHFKVLHKRLSSHEWVAPPPLPPLHTARQQLDRYSAAFVAARTTGLNAFLDRVARHPIFSHSEDFRLFVTTPDEEFDKVFRSESSALNLWGLSSAIYGSGENKPPNNGPRVKDPEWSSHVEYLTSLQHKLTALASLTSKLHKGTVQLTSEMMNMKRACDAWSSQARGATARAAAACAAGAGAAARAPPAPRAPVAVLPLLAAYTAAHVDKIRHRDQLHAAYVSGNNASGEIHNKLEQCSEALRSELSDWLPKTRGEVKSLLLELADSQLALHTRAHAGWEHALRLSHDANVEELFKTVSKTAVQNLSPSRCRSEMTPTETERDLDDLENYSNDSDSFVERTNERGLSERTNEREFSEKSDRNNDRDLFNDKMNDMRLDSERINDKNLFSERVNDKDLFSERMNDTALDSESMYDKKVISEMNDKELFSERTIDKQVSEKTQNQNSSERTNEQSSSGKTEWVEVNEVLNDPLNINNGSKTQDMDDFLSEILDDTEPSCSKDDKEIKDSTSLEQSLKSDVVSDPLREFSDVDLS